MAQRMAQHTPLVHERIKTPRVAAVAGIVFSVLFSTALILLRISLPANYLETSASPSTSSEALRLALSLLPFAGIALLWFVGVIRDRLGAYEDRFFATLFLGTGILFLAMLFSATAMTGAIVIALDAVPDHMISGGYILVRAIMDRTMNVYGIKMAGVFMISCATLATRTHVLPRVITLPGYALAALLLVCSHFVDWLALAFPLWVFVLSAYILVDNMRTPSAITAASPTEDKV